MEYKKLVVKLIIEEYYKNPSKTKFESLKEFSKDDEIHITFELKSNGYYNPWVHFKNVTKKLSGNFEQNKIFSLLNNISFQQIN